VLELLGEGGRYAEANALLRRLPEAAVASPELGRVAAGVTLLGAGSGAGPEGELGRARALELARKAVAANSKDHRDYLWLGRVAAQAGRPQEAETAFRRARELAEGDPEAWAALVLFLANTDAKRAEAELAEAERRPPPGKASLALAPCYEALGQMEKAEAHYR